MVIYDFHASETNELSLKKGDILKVLDDTQDPKYSVKPLDAVDSE